MTTQQSGKVNNPSGQPPTGGRRRNRRRNRNNNKNPKNQNQQKPKNNNSQRGRGRRNNRSMNFNQISAPNAIGFQMSSARTFATKRTMDPRWGEGISLEFSQAITTLQGEGLSQPDSILPISVSQVPNSALVASGIVATDLSACSGLLIHPSMLGGRFTTETNNWTRYRFRSLTASCIPLVGTSSPGSILLHINTDPNKWPEVVDDGKGNLAPSLVNLSSARPIVEGPIWGEQSVTVQSRGPETWPTEVDDVKYDTSDAGILGTLAYIRETYQYRMAALTENVGLGTFGRLYLSGVLEFYQPSYGFTSGVGVVPISTEPSLSSTSMGSLPRGSWKTKVVVGSSFAKEEQKRSHPDDPIMVPPAPILKRTGGVDSFLTRMTRI